MISVADEESQIREFRVKAHGGNRTTLRVVSQENEQIVWVDVENENHNSDLSGLERPRELVTSLIKTSENSGGTPKRGKSEFHMLLPRPTDTNILHFVALSFCFTFVSVDIVLQRNELGFLALVRKKDLFRSN